MSADVLVIGLDSCSATLLERWADAGDLPHFAALRRRAAGFRLEAACMETLPGAIWGDITMGEPGWRHGQFYHFEQFRPEEGACRPIRESDIDASRSIWGAASAAGRRSAVVDVPFTPILGGFNGVQIREFAVHDLWAGAASDPPGLLEGMLAEDGEPPLHSMWCDIRVANGGREQLLRELLSRADAKTRLLRKLMARGGWNLFFAVYGETHCAGHNLWPHHRNGTLVSPVAGIDDPWGALRDVYKRVDAGIGALIADAGPQTRIVIFTSHGVGPYLGGPQILVELLRRLGLSDGWDWPGRRMLRELALKARRQIEVSAAEEIAPFRMPAARGLRSLLGAERYPGNSPRCRAFAMPNNRTGAIRLKIAGRDKGGMLSPSDAEAVLDLLTRELNALTEKKSGTKAVKSIERTAELFGTERSALTPDLIVEFRTDIGPIEDVHSPRVGAIHAPNQRPGYRRHGDHVPQSHAWIAAPNYSATGGLVPGNIIDLAPTVLSLLGVSPPAHMTGDVLRADLGVAASA